MSGASTNESRRTGRPKPKSTCGRERIDQRTSVSDCGSSGRQPVSWSSSLAGPLVVKAETIAVEAWWGDCC
jgi:hypothetical protein